MRGTLGLIECCGYMEVRKRFENDDRNHSCGRPCLSLACHQMQPMLNPFNSALGRHDFMRKRNCHMEI